MSEGSTLGFCVRSNRKGWRLWDIVAVPSKGGGCQLALANLQVRLRTNIAE